MLIKKGHYLLFCKKLICLFLAILVLAQFTRFGVKLCIEKQCSCKNIDILHLVGMGMECDYWNYPIKFSTDTFCSYNLCCL